MAKKGSSSSNKKSTKEDNLLSKISTGLAITFLLVNPSGIDGMCVNDSGDDFNVTDIKGKFNEDKKTFTGKFSIPMNKQQITITVKDIEYDALKNDGFKKMVEEANKQAISTEVTESSTGDVPGRVLTVTESGSLEPVDGIIQQDELNKTEEIKKEISGEIEIPDTSKSEKVGPIKEEEVDSNKEPIVIDKWAIHRRVKIGDLKAEIRELQRFTHDITQVSIPHFIGLHLDKEGMYVPLATPSEIYDEQYIFVGKTKKVADFLYGAFLNHPEFRDGCEKLKTIPITAIADDDNEIEVLVITNGLEFIRQL